MKRFVIKAKFTRRFPDPLNKEGQEGLENIHHHILLCKAVNVPAGIPTDPNPRAQRTDKTLYKRVKESLLQGQDPTFHLKNKGITLIAHSVTPLESPDEMEILVADGDGIIDGGHTYKIILENMDECPDDQYVRIEVLVGIPRYMIEPIAEGLNTAVQVQEMSLANLSGKFKWIEETLADEPYAEKIAYKENEDGDFNIREIIGLMTLFNISAYPNQSSHPKIAYTSKAKCLEDYLNNIENYEKLKPLLKDILNFYDYVHLKSRKLYNDKYRGKAGALAFYQSRKRGKYKLTFTDSETQHKLFDGALYPILSAFRFLIEEDKKTNTYRWKLGSYAKVKEFFDEVGGDIINLTKNTSDSKGKNPNAIGKDDNHWDNLYKTVALAYLMHANQ